MATPFVRKLCVGRDDLGAPFFKGRLFFGDGLLFEGGLLSGDGLLSGGAPFSVDGGLGRPALQVYFVDLSYHGWSTMSTRIFFRIFGGLSGKTVVN